MTAVDDRPGLGCVKRDADQPCPGRPIVRYAVGPVCSEHLLPGAEVYEWLTDPAALDDADLDRVAEVLEQIATAPLGPPLPVAARAVAAAHVDAAPGEAAAARLMAYKAGSIRERVLDHLAAAGPAGTTAIEAWHWYQATYSPTTERYYVLSQRGRRQKGLSW